MQEKYFMRNTAIQIFVDALKRGELPFEAERLTLESMDILRKFNFQHNLMDEIGIEWIRDCIMAGVVEYGVTLPAELPDPAEYDQWYAEFKMNIFLNVNGERHQLEGYPLMYLLESVVKSDSGAVSKIRALLDRIENQGRSPAGIE